MRDPSPHKVGLALGGGVVRGFAHIGVLEVLEEHHIPIDYISGASVGALIGLCYATGMKALHLREVADRLGWRNLFSPILPRRGLISFERLEEFLVDVLGDLHFDDLALPFAVSTTDMRTGEPVLINEGRAAQAVRASCSVPGFVEPIEINGRILGDGGVANNLPAEAVRDMGAEYVIGVDIFQSALDRPLGPLAPGLAAVEIMVRRSGSGLRYVDCLISPDLEKFTYINILKKRELIQRGRDAAKAALPEIEAELGLKN